MALFSCNKCKAVYEDYYPTDDTCCKCGSGTIWIIPEYKTTEDLARLITGMKLKLDCGHHCTIGHNFSNTLIIHSLGGGRIKTECHECGY